MGGKNKGKFHHHSKSDGTSMNKPRNGYSNPFKKNINYNKNRDFKKKFETNSNLMQHDATPWSELKHQNLSTNAIEDNEDASQIPNPFKHDNRDRQEFLKKRNQNHMRFLIQEKQKEKPKWETFNEEIPFTSTSATSVARNNESRCSNSNDSLKMSARKANFYRKVITRCTALSKGGTLAAAINDLKRKGVRKNN